MSSAWKWKLALFCGIVLLSVYFLIPTFLGFQQIREDAEKTGKPLPWHLHLFPKKGLNLGLDLQGGIYLEFEVELDRAIENRIDLITGDLERGIKEKHGEGIAVRHDRATRTMLLSGKDAAQLGNGIEYLRQYYGDDLEKISVGVTSEPTEAYHLSKDYLDRLRDQIVRQALEKVRNRIDRYGVAEPTIQRLGSNRIAVELPGVKDPDRAIGLIKKAGQLEFKLIDESISLAALTQMIADARKANTLPEDFSIQTAMALTKALSDKLPSDTEIAFETKFDPIAKKIVNGTPFLLHRKAELTGEMLKNAQTNINDNEPHVSLSFDAQGSTLFGELTSKNVGKRLAILLDGVVNSAPVIREAILGGQAQISLGYGSFNELVKEAEDLSLVLQEGALPAQLTEETKTIVGPSLGTDSIRKGVTATLVGLAVIFLFMTIYYKTSGIIANMALIFNVLLLLAALAMLQATLTLPGIAGIVLTLAMAIDANVLLLERMREEQESGKQVRAVVEVGYGNAMRTIIDSNVTTLIAGVVLYQFGTGPIKGFAVTLITGLIISMYTACMCTRMVYDYMVTKRRIDRISL